LRTFEPIAQRTLHGARRLSAPIRRLGRPAAMAGALLLAISTATVWGTANTAPQFISLTASAAVIAPGETLVVNGSFTDPDPGDRHTVFVYWSGGDVSVKEKVQLPAGQTTFQLRHTYTEPLSRTQIKIVLTDHQLPPGSNDNTEGAGWDDGFLPIEVRRPNVAPSFVDSSIRIQMVQHTGGVYVEVDGEWIDPDPEDGRVTIRSGVGPPSRSVSPCDTTGRQFYCVRELGYSSSKQYALELKVEDGHRGIDTYSTTVRLP